MERAVAGRSAVVPDVRGEGRALRATWHHEAGVVVLSVWRDNVCVATSRLRPEEAAALFFVQFWRSLRGASPDRFASQNRAR